MSADIHSLVGAYAVDALDDAERAEFEQHLAECAACRAEVASLRAAAHDLSLLSRTEPPAAMRDAVLGRVSAIRPLPPTGLADPADDVDEAGDAAGPRPQAVVPLRRRRVVAWVASAAAAAAVVVGGLTWSPWSSDAPDRSPTEQVLAAQDAQRFEKTIDGARATIVRSAAVGRAVIIADNMPSAPDGKDFQVWLDLPGRGMVSAGVMPHGSASTLTMLLEGDAARATGAGITLEPAGGSAAPTTEPIALFSFS
jgi:anti-sigma-K factor RskA